ncbi:MAG: TauD/TfdA family dioxygenase [Rhodospirillales bacterium]|nr:TauD/TfdA family dioxygenase [Rhodospirillales bacterium]
MALNVTPLSDAIGAEISGADLTKDLPDDAFKTIRQAWLDHKLVLFRDQPLTQEQHANFARRFGEIQAIRSATHIVGNDQEFMYVSNRDVDGMTGILPEGEMHFHNDQSYYEYPAKATILNAVEIPKQGGNTLFLNTALAYARIDDAMKARLDGLNVLNIYDYDTNPTIKGNGIRADAPQFTHPVVIRHPDSGERALFVSRLMSDHIVGLEREESDALLSQLFDHMEQPQFIYEHSWTPGDLLMWDNFASQHARTDFDAAEARTLRRIAVQGPKPIAAGLTA